MNQVERGLLAARVKQRRKENLMTVEEAARSARMPYGTYVNVEFRAKMGFKSIKKILKWLKKTNGLQDGVRLS